MFSYVCWAAFTNVPINQLFGFGSGMGMVFWLAVRWWVSFLSRTLWIFSHVPDICQPNQVSQLTCPHNQVFYTASVVWWVLVFYPIHISYLIDHHFQGSHWPSMSIRYRLRLSLRHNSGSLHPCTMLPLATALLRFMGSLSQHTPTAGLSAIPPATGISSWFLSCVYLPVFD